MIDSLSDSEWLAEQIDTIPHSHEIITPSEYLITGLVHGLIV